MVVVFYISGHGFGHATRDFEVISHIRQQAPATRVVVRSLVPAWFAARALGPGVEIQRCEADTGVVQIDSLRLDEEATARRAADFYQHFADRVADEAGVLRSLGARVVVGDVPPLAFAAARAAGVPSVALANFTWDWILAAYPAVRALAPSVLDVMGDAYASTTIALRLPFHGGFDRMPTVRDIPLVARRSTVGRNEARRRLALDSARPIVLASFGGHGARMPLDVVARHCNVIVLATDFETAGLDSTGAADRLRAYTHQDLDRFGLRYEDLVAAADVVVTKPGYGIVSECIANHTSLLYTSRGRFAENDVMVEAMRRVLRCRFIDQDDIRSGRWQPHVSDLLAQPWPAERMAANGAPIAAAEILDRARHKS
jgi:L-arabinokinase